MRWPWQQSRWLRPCSPGSCDQLPRCVPESERRVRIRISTRGSMTSRAQPESLAREQTGLHEESEQRGVADVFGGGEEVREGVPGQSPVFAGMPTTCRWWQLAAASEGVASYCGNTGGPRSLQGGRSSRVCAQSIRVQRRLQRPGEAGEVAVVDAAVIELIGEFAQQPRPVSPSRFQGDADVHPSLDDRYRGPARGGRPGLFPRAVATGGLSTTWGSVLGFAE